MKRLFYPAERPINGQCPACGGVLTHIFVSELIDTALPWRDGNVRDAPRWICRRCWGVDDRDALPGPDGQAEVARSWETA